MIDTKRFILKPITSKDVNNNYLSWLDIEISGGYIDYAKNTITLVDLMQYVKERENQKNILFLAIFDKITNQHIGNIKYEPINFDDKTATMGILIGDKNWRGKGVASEVITASAKYLKKTHHIKMILLGVDKTNIPALSAYQKIGFSIDKKQDNSIKMSLTL